MANGDLLFINTQCVHYWRCISIREYHNFGAWWIIRYPEFRSCPLFESSKCIVSMGIAVDWYLECCLFYGACPLLEVSVNEGSTVFWKTPCPVCMLSIMTIGKYM